MNNLETTLIKKNLIKTKQVINITPDTSTDTEYTDEEDYKPNDGHI